MTPEPLLPPERPTEAARNRMQRANFRRWRSQQRLDKSQMRGVNLPQEVSMTPERLRCTDCGAAQQTHPEIDPGWVWITLGGIRRVFCPPCVCLEGPQQCMACGNWHHERYDKTCPWCAQ